MKEQDLEKLTLEKGLELLQKSQKGDSVFLEKNWWYKKMLSWTMNNHSLKTRLFHFIDVLSSLSESEDKKVLSIFNEYFKDQELGFIGSGLGKVSPGLFVKNIKKQVQQVAKIFITGANVEEALPVLQKNWNNNLAFSIDILNEATLSEKEAQDCFNQYMELMDTLNQNIKTWPQKERLQSDSLGPLPSINVSVKASSIFSQIKVEAWEYSKEEIKKRLRPLYRKAIENFIFINLDVEHYEHKDLLMETFKELLGEEEFKNYPHFGIVIQTYLRESFEDLQRLVRFAEQRGKSITIRLVKGAYWDSEVLLARQKNWPIPVYTRKAETDVNFEKCAKYLFENSQKVKIAIGSHNIRSISYCLALHKLYPKAQMEFQVLYGMGEGLAQALLEKKYCVRLYSTIGELIPGMSYLVRRLLENSANQSFVLSSFLKNKKPEELLADPGKILSSMKPEEKKPDLRDLRVNLPEPLLADPDKHLIEPKQKEIFQNHPLLDFSKKENRENFQIALKKVKKQFPVEVPLILQGKKVKSPEILKRENPSQTDYIISNSFLASKEQAEQAVSYTHSFFEEWKLSSPRKRIENTKKLASLLQQKELELAALQVFEVGKTWKEAQADVAEAIDFCNYYALSYEKLIQKKKTSETAGEESFFHYEAIGPTAVISPWNFPLAILTGMTVAPLLCGNPVLIKPSAQSALTGLRLAELLSESGFPKESFAFLPGKGEVIGDYLVSHSKVSIISFTGSFEVGAQIIKKAGQINKDQKDIKKCIVEMGGKNAIVVDSSADLDEAIRGILDSAFGFQGQKCSACSRVVVVEDVYRNFSERFIPAVESLVVGSSEKPEVSVGPLVDERAFTRIKSFMEQEKNKKLYEGKYKNSTDSLSSWIRPPVVYHVEDENADLMQRELFAPVLAVFKVKNLDEAIQQVNKTSFGLTAGFYSRQPSHIEKFKSLVEVGNVYVNRNCTGALVERHPFGGRKMSGLGSKTGGPEYLKQFLHTKILTENKMRRGFSPELFE